MSIGTGTGQITRPQPQVAQLELTFAGPLVKDSYVESSADLINFNITTNYEQKLIWSKADRAFWYLNSGDGSMIAHWKMLIGRITLEQYDPVVAYQADSVVFQAGKIYKARVDVEANNNPEQNGDKWLLIAGESVTYRFVFKDVSQTTIVTAIRNPLFEIIIGDIQMDGNTYVLDDDGMIKVLNQEIVEATVKKSDVDPQTYIISFESDMLPYVMSGIINVR
jgi:hypothetical protein